LPPKWLVIVRYWNLQRLSLRHNLLRSINFYKRATSESVCCTSTQSLSSLIFSDGNSFNNTWWRSPRWIEKLFMVLYLWLSLSASVEARIEPFAFLISMDFITLPSRRTLSPIPISVSAFTAFPARVSPAPSGLMVSAFSKTFTLKPFRVGHGEC
jgi:hypothetical protein